MILSVALEYSVNVIDPTNIFACLRVGLPVAGVGTVEDKVAA